jgi:hypothetical protein
MKGECGRRSTHTHPITSRNVNKTGYTFTLLRRGEPVKGTDRATGVTDQQIYDISTIVLEVFDYSRKIDEVIVKSAMSPCSQSFVAAAR